MSRLGLAETIAALRDELESAVRSAVGQEIQFPVGGVEIELHVGVTKSAKAKGGFQFWVLELGASAEYATESIQKVTLQLEAPVDDTGTTIKVARALADSKP